MVHVPPLIIDLTLILGAAGLVTLLFKKLNQPLVLGYLITGFLLSPNFSVLPSVTEMENIQIWSEIGVIFLLFGLGLEFSFKKMVKIGGAAGITALVKVSALIGIGYISGQLLGWSQMDSIFLGGLLSISSTAITMRSLEEQGLKGQQFAGLVFGILVIEDLVAILLMVILSTIAISREFAGGELLFSLTKLSVFLVISFVAGIFLLPTFLKKARKLMNEETLLVVSIGLCLLMVFIASEAGFSPALGAFLMGSILSETILSEKIEHIFKPVRDLFGAIFFVSVGMMLDASLLREYWLPITVLTGVTLVAKFGSSLAGALLSGQSLKTSVQIGMSLAQIGEFSFIIATLGLSLKVTSEFLYPIAIALSVVTALTTPYMIRLSEPAYQGIRKILPAKFLKNISRYSSSTQTVKTVSEGKQVMRIFLWNTILFTLITISIAILSNQYVLPFFLEKSEGTPWGKILAESITFVAMAPFLWALAFRRDQNPAVRNLWKRGRFRGLILVLRLSRFLLAIVCLTIWLEGVFANRLTLILIPVAGVVMILFSKKIQRFYDKLESRFLSNYHEKEKNEKRKSVMDQAQLAPWDAHLADFEVDADFPHIGKTLAELALRERLGINIAMIRRGKLNITAPTRHEKIYPGDKIYAIGTDAQIENFNQYLNTEISAGKLEEEKEVVLRQFLLGPESPLLQRTIRESGIREKTEGLIIGIERNGKRILNPESHFAFEEGDLIWIVGNKDKVHHLQ